MKENIKKQSLKSLLNVFESTLDSTLNQVWNEKDKSEHLDALVNGASKITHYLMQIGEYVQNGFENNSLGESEILPGYIIHFSWMEEVKSFMILWRDIIFEYQKGLVFEKNQKITIEVLGELQLNSFSTIKVGATHLKDFLENETKSIGQNNRVLRNSIADWKKIKNPWETYRRQLEAILDQCEKLRENNSILINSSKIFQNIEELIDQNISASKTEIKQLRVLAEEAIELVEENVKEKPGKLSTLLEQMESKLETNQYLELMNISIEEKLAGLVENERFFIETNHGALQYREANLKNNAKLWLDSETTPLIYEFWEINDQILNSFKMALMNIRNRAMLFSNELKKENGAREEIDPRFDLEKFCYPLNSFLQKTSSWENDQKELSNTIQARLDNDFQICEIFNTEKNFLPIPLQTTINQYRLTQNPWIKNTRAWFSVQINRFQKFISTVEQEDALSTSEKIVRYVQNKQSSTNHQQYANIFLTKGYMGKSFWVGRRSETDRFKNIVDQWRLGFRGAVILSGQRFSGKSLFGEYVSSQHFSQKSIRLTPNSTIKVGGRILETTYDLGAAIDSIQKYSINDESLIWVDDFENWSDPNIPLGKNMRALSKAIDNHSGRLFFLVSMGNWTKSHLNLTYDIEKVFQATINLDKMSSSEIREAILIRHGATHKILVNKNKEEITPQDFQKMTDSIYRYTQGNIGEALSRWSYSIKKIDEEKVIYQAPINYAFPDFLNPDASIILSTLMMEKRTNEYRLRKLFGSPFQTKFKFIIQRLISVGVLTRHLDGWLEINEYVVNDIGKMLEEKNYIKFH